LQKSLESEATANERKSLGKRGSIPLRDCDVGAEYRRPMPTASRWWRMLQLLEKVDEPSIMWVIDIEIAPKAALDKDVGQISEAEKTAKGKFFHQQGKNVLSANSFKPGLRAIAVIIFLLHSFQLVIWFVMIGMNFQMP
jgi:hypothetical protein